MLAAVDYWLPLRCGHLACTRPAAHGPLRCGVCRRPTPLDTSGEPVMARAGRVVEAPGFMARFHWLLECGHEQPEPVATRSSMPAGSYLVCDTCREPRMSVTVRGAYPEA